MIYNEKQIPVQKVAHAVRTLEISIKMRTNSKITYTYIGHKTTEF